MKRTKPLAILTLALALLAPTAASAQKKRVSHPVTARGLVCKICGCIDPSLDKACVTQAARDSLCVEPTFEEEGMWLDSVDGFALVYDEMAPEVSVLVSFDDKGRVANYTYFFTFPYTDYSRGEANVNQAFFTGAMLQELYDANALISANETSAIEMFDIDGAYADKVLNLRLMDDPYTVNPPLSGQFILLMEVDNGQPPMAQADF